jgi:LysM repeat protein
MDAKEKKELSYTVVKTEDIPEEVQNVIQEKKSEPFQMTYQSGDFLYILRGYGLQNSGGYSITVNKVTTSEDAIHVTTELIVPTEKDEEQNVSYPFIAIKTEYKDLPVVFD